MGRKTGRTEEARGREEGSHGLMVIEQSFDLLIFSLVFESEKYINPLFNRHNFLHTIFTAVMFS